MATVSMFSLCGPNAGFRVSSSASNAAQFHIPCIKFQCQFKNSAISSVVKFNKHSSFRPTKVRAVAEEEETLIPEEETSPPPAAAASDQTVSVPVSPSDVLNMLFQAEGTMADAAVPAVTKALEEVEGITDLKVQVHEGLASVELTKQTTVQATGVASNLVEIIQGSGFKLQTLNLSFQDEEDFS
ncbi:hypothetical protein BUALT_Bualt04G0154800 [Buddleja alternifolia]|uniref:HMA domain-containing protein n=1 Tax=Buddleja alternifolia TaxID=168488 RepID=A0AAV6XX95_9LAMI|nr:hypothetical protein BUALT_Bualt04G0154800 [Buddleja alternifolia]